MTEACHVVTLSQFADFLTFQALPLVTNSFRKQIGEITHCYISQVILEGEDVWSNSIKYKAAQTYLIVHLSQWLEGFQKLLAMNVSSSLILNRVLLWPSEKRMTEKGSCLKGKKWRKKGIIWTCGVTIATAPNNIRSALCLQAQNLQNEKQMTTREGVCMKKERWDGGGRDLGWVVSTDEEKNYLENVLLEVIFHLYFLVVFPSLQSYVWLIAGGVYELFTQGIY